MQNVFEMMNAVSDEDKKSKPNRRRGRRRRIEIHPKYIYLIFFLFCVFMIVLTYRFPQRFAGVKSIAGDIVSPMQKGINRVGKTLSNRRKLFSSKKKLVAENEELKEQIDALKYDNRILASENSDLDIYKELYALDQKYPDYPKVAATVIGRDGNNWFHLFTIDKGKADGVDVDMNVIAGNGLVGIVSEAGNHYAKVRSVIDDKSNVSSMFEKTGETCIVSGNMETIYKGYIDVSMISNSVKAEDGDSIVTSQISDKFLPGLLVGYVTNMEEKSDGLSQVAQCIPAVSFNKLENVLVITTLKDSSENKDILNYD